MSGAIPFYITKRFPVISAEINYMLALLERDMRSETKRSTNDIVAACERL